MDIFRFLRTAPISSSDSAPIAWYSPHGRRVRPDRDRTPVSAAWRVTKAITPLVLVAALFAAAVTVKWMRFHPSIRAADGLAPASVLEDSQREPASAPASH